jgi:hypothetical protein
MKKFAILSLVLALGLVFGCGEAKKAPKASPPPAAEAPKTDAAPAAEAPKTDAAAPAAEAPKPDAAAPAPAEAPAGETK